MLRSRLLLTVLGAGGAGVLLLASGLFLGAASDPVVTVNPPAEVKSDSSKALQAVREKLSRPINLPKGIDPNTPLKDALEFISELYDLSILVDQAAFKLEGQGDPNNAPVSLPKLTGVATRTALQRLLGALDPPATFLVRGDHLLVVPRRMTQPAAWEPSNRHAVPVVDLTFDRRPLETALREVSEQTGINVVLDVRVADKAKASVTATFTQAAVDTTVYLLADMADLKAVALDNVLYVTSKANADALTAEMTQGKLRNRFTPSDTPMGK